MRKLKGEADKKVHTAGGRHFTGEVAISDIMEILNLKVLISLDRDKVVYGKGTNSTSEVI